jgi:ribosomal protein S18 acetylase RimI-like enzyme
MRSLAELIEVAFASNLEAENERMLGWMKLIGRMGWFGWLLSIYLLPPAARPQGFVWEAEGKLVGNASVLPVGGHHHRWIMVNVAVHPEFQRRGIARQLVQACIDHVRQRAGRVLLLQTESENPGAHVLYTDLGFKKIAERTTWVGQLDKRSYRTDSKGLARPRTRDEWRDQMSLARRVHSEGLIWPYPLGTGFYRSGNLMDSIVMGGNRHWVVREDDEMVGSLSLRWSPEIDAWRMILVVDPKAHEKIERDLLVCGLADLPMRRAKIELEYPSGVAEAQLTELGFVQKRRLTWMECRL